jgi:hypothetical protein
MDRDGWKRIIPKGRWIIIQSGLHYHNTPFCTHMTNSPRLDEKRGENDINIPLCWEDYQNGTRVVDWQLPASSTKTAKKYLQYDGKFECKKSCWECNEYKEARTTNMLRVRCTYFDLTL